ncbi:hypothetical protein [Gemmata sp.]|uniref:hypothetical protein n=1 Tax=Gemmata sp. TaxID=1914242 RepID=UPI003F72D8A4
MSESKLTIRLEADPSVTDPAPVAAPAGPARPAAPPAPATLAAAGTAPSGRPVGSAPTAAPVAAPVAPAAPPLAPAGSAPPMAPAGTSARDAARQKRGVAWRQNKTRQRRVNRIKDRRAEVAAQQKQAGADAAYEAARKSAPQVVAKQREHEQAVKRVGDASRARVAGEQRTAARGAAVGRWADRAGSAGAWAGRAASGVAAGSTAPAIGGAIEGAVAGLNRLGPYGAAAGVAMATVAKVGSAAGDALDALAKRGRELGQFNGQIAAASANADVRSLMAQVREGGALGGQYAELIDRQSKMEDALSEGLLPVKEFLLNVANRALEAGVPFMADCLEALNGILAGVSFGMARSESIDKAVARIRATMEDRAAPADDLFTEWLRTAETFHARGVEKVPAPGNIGVPILDLRRER